MSTSTSPGPLAGLRVVELCHVMAGPVCGLMLADLGADVIKVEKASGDDLRRQTPAINGESAAYMMMNRNKRGIVLDLKHPDGKAILRRLVERADVVTENYRADTLPSLGLGYDDLRKVNPRLIYASITGFGRTGPLADRGGFDLVAQGMSGLMSITGEAAGRPPVKVGSPVCDITAGLLLAMGVLAALAHRDRTGEGQMVDTSLFEAGVTLTYWQTAIALATGVSPGPMGSAHPLNAPYQAFRTADGWINIGAANQSTWEALLRALDAGQLGDDARFATGPARMANLDALVETLAPMFAPLTTAVAIARLEAEGVPCGPVLSISEMLAHPQTAARTLTPTLEHPVAGKMRTLGLPVKFSQSPGGVRTPAPTLGQHTRDVLLQAGFDVADIERFAASGAARTGAA